MKKSIVLLCFAAVSLPLAGNALAAEPDSVIGDLNITEGLSYKLESQSIAANSLDLGGNVTFDSVETTIQDTTGETLKMGDNFKTREYFKNNTKEFEVGTGDHKGVIYHLSNDGSKVGVKLGSTEFKDIVVGNVGHDVTVGDLAGYADSGKTGSVNITGTVTTKGATTLTNLVKGKAINFEPESELDVNTGQTTLTADNINLLGKTSVANGAELSTNGDAKITKLEITDGGSFENQKGTSVIDEMTTTVGTGANVKSAVAAGGRFKGGSTEITKATLKMTDGAVGKVTLGAVAENGATGEAVIKESVGTISGGNVRGSVVALGGVAKNTSKLTMENSTLNIESGKIESDIFGGSYTAGQGSSSIVKNAKINISGGEIKSGKSIYGGGYMDGATEKNESIVENFTVTFSGNANASGSTNYASLDNGYDGLRLYGKEGKAENGNKSPNEVKHSALVFDKYNGDFKATVKGFDTIELTNDSNVTTDLTLENGSTFAFNVENSASGLTGSRLGGRITLSKNSAVNLSPLVAVDIRDGDFQFADTVESERVVDESDTEGKWNLLSSNNVYNIVLKPKANNTITITRKSISELQDSLATTDNNAKTVDALLKGTSNGDNAAFDRLATQINTDLQSSDSSVVKSALKKVEQMSSDATSVVQSTRIANVEQAFNAVADHLAENLVVPANTGRSGGDEGNRKVSVWAQGLLNSAKLSKDNGFDSDSKGMLIGLEADITESVKLGLGNAFNRTNIDTDSRSIKADTDSVIAYGEYKPSDWYMNAVLSYSFGSYDEDATVKTAKYNVNSFAAWLVSGYNFNAAGFGLTPEVGLRYLNIVQDKYVDTLGSSVSKDTSNILTGVLSGRFAKEFALGNAVNLRPEVRLGITYDLMNSDSTADIVLANGSSYTVKGEPLNRFGFEAGAGLTAKLGGGFELSAWYEGRFRENYRDHTGLLNLKYNF